jgi:hypothetical protein
MPPPDRTDLLRKSSTYVAVMTHPLVTAGTRPVSWQFRRSPGSRFVRLDAAGGWEPSQQVSEMRLCVRLRISWRNRAGHEQIPGAGAQRQDKVELVINPRLPRPAVPARACRRVDRIRIAIAGVHRSGLGTTLSSPARQIPLHSSRGHAA